MLLKAKYTPFFMLSGLMLFVNFVKMQSIEPLFCSHGKNTFRDSELGPNSDPKVFTSY